MQHYIAQNPLDKRTVEILVRHGPLPARFSERRDPMATIDYAPGKGPFNPAWTGSIREWMDRNAKVARRSHESDESESCAVLQFPEEDDEYMI